MILVDGITDYTGMTKLRHKQWCHMVSDVGEDELHAFAARLGLKRSWAQLRPKASAAHYDLTPAKRALAIELGAIAVTSRELVKRNYDGIKRRLDDGIRKLECATCGKPATCIGRYEDMEIDEPACDGCCGHGCEDGHCDQLFFEENDLKVALGEAQVNECTPEARIRFAKLIKAALERGKS